MMYWAAAVFMLKKALKINMQVKFWRRFRAKPKKINMEVNFSRFFGLF